MTGMTRWPNEMDGKAVEDKEGLQQGREKEMG
jgi:hypothetical protein